MTSIYVITERPRDYPDRAVLRRHVYAAGAESFVADFHPTAVAPTVEEARGHLPRGVRRFEPMVEDGAGVEVWA